MVSSSGSGRIDLIGRRGSELADLSGANWPPTRRCVRRYVRRHGTSGGSLVPATDLGLVTALRVVGMPGLVDYL